MGIDISADKRVSFNPDHEHRVITATGKNPKITAIGNAERITVYSIYRRTKFGDTDRDGNPLIYSLKGIYNYRITNEELCKFKPSFIAILNKIRQRIPEKPFALFAMPSSSNVSCILARRISRLFGITMHTHCVIKRTARDVLAYYDTTSPDIADSHKKMVFRVLAELRKSAPNTVFSMKHVPNKIRHYFPPWKLNPDFNYTIDNNSVVILVDDLLSTGTTLISASSELRNAGLSCTTAICLLSNL